MDKFTLIINFLLKIFAAASNKHYYFLQLTSFGLKTFPAILKRRSRGADDAGIPSIVMATSA